MSWHVDQLQGGAGEMFSQRDARMVLNILGNLTSRDELELKEKLTKMPEVNSVVLNLATNKLTVGFDIRKIKVEQIAYRVSQLGYRYIKRA